MTARARPMIVLLMLVAAQRPAAAATAMSTEDFLDTLGVNTHIDGNSGWDTDVARVAEHLRYIGVRLQRDWPSSAAEGERFKALHDAWSPLARVWTSVNEDGPARQRDDLGFCEAIVTAYGTDLVYAMGGPNEEDGDYAQKLGATLPDAAAVQGLLWTWAHDGSRGVRVSQMEFGAGWVAANGWKGDYDPGDTGIHQPYAPGAADLAAAHSYLSDPKQTPKAVLDHLRDLAHLTTPGKPVAHTETGIYRTVPLDPGVVARFIVAGAFDSAAAGDAGYLVYGLQDSDTYGFYDAQDLRPNPLADGFHALTTILASARGAYAPGAARTFVPGQLAIAWSDACAHLLLQKPTGEFVVAAWSEQLMDGSQHPVTDTIGFGRRFAHVAVYDVESGTTPISSAADAESIALTLQPCDVYLIELSEPR